MNYTQETEHKTPVSQLFSAAFVSSLIVLRKKNPCNLLMRVNYGAKISQSSQEAY